MSVQRTPPKTINASPTMHSSYRASDPELNKSYDTDISENFRITKRQKRTCTDFSDNSTSLSEIRNMFTELKTQQEKRFGLFTSTMNTLIEQNNDIKKSVEFMSGQYDDLLQKINQLETENLEYKRQVKFLENRLEFHEKHTRSSTIELRNVPKQESESKQIIMNIVKDIGNVLKIEPQIQDMEIRDVYRIKSDAIVVDFISTVRKEIYLQKCKQLNKIKRDTKQPQLNTHDLKLSGPQKTIFISEYLTNKARRLYYLARELVKNKKLIATWTSYGKVYVRRDEGQGSIRIDEEGDLRKIIL